MLCLALLFTSACLQLQAPQVSGNITDASGRPVSNATVSVVSTGLTTRTNGEGAYVLAGPGVASGASVAVTAASVGFARQTRIARVTSHAQPLSFVLRNADLFLPISLAADASQNTNTNGWSVVQGPNGVVVTKSVDDGGMSLTIPAGSLVTPRGTVAQGNAILAVTYWQPEQSLRDAPGALSAAFNGQTVPLQTYGMTDIQILQGNELLQVGSGTHLPTSFKLPAALRSLMNQLSPSDSFYPAMWYENESTGLWEQQGTAAQGNLTYDSDAGVITAMLPHLSGWNIDAVSTPNGCVQGRAVDSAGHPVSSKQFNLWLIGLVEPIAQDYETMTDAEGNFCVNVQGVQGKQGDGSNTTAPVFASYGDPQNSMCNPLPITQLNQCVAEPDHCIGGGYGPDVPAGYNGCSLPIATIVTCHYCPGTVMDHCFLQIGDALDSHVTPTQGGCPDMGTIILSSPGGGNTACNTAVAGQACQTEADCCGLTTGLTCADYLCVPSSD